MKKNAEMKAESMIREVILFPIAIIYFPYATIRILIWKWHFWVENNNQIIKQYKRNLEDVG